VRAGLNELHDLLIGLLAIPSPSGSERALADAVSAHVRGLGLEVTEDDSASRTGLGSGNLLVRVPGRGQGTRLAFCAHLDTVPIDRPPVVVVENGVVRSDGTSILGADDKAAVAVLLALLSDLAADPPPVPVEVLFTPGEEIGLQGAKALAPDALQADLVFVLDSEGDPGSVIRSAPTLTAVAATFEGVAAHAGIDPEQGRSAVVAAARAIAAMRLGRVDERTTANVGVVQGGSADNVVPERCLVRAEARSRDAERLAAQVAHMIGCLQAGATETGVDVHIDVREEFKGYEHRPRSLPLRLAAAAAADAGLEFTPRDGGGGSDSNVFNARGLPAVTLGVGFAHVHSPQERVHLDRVVELHRFAHALVRAASG
jgi:tripeptide aminopeptidase